MFRTWRLNRYNAICVIQKLYRTQIENIRLRAIQEAVRLEQLRAAAADKFAALWKGRQSRNFVANKLREKRRALAFRKKRLLAALLIQARARGMICREGIRRRLMEEAWKRQQGMAQVREDAALVIECAQRCRMARWLMRKRRAERRAEEEEREKDRLLELALDRLKKEQEINLLAMRVQCLWRRRKASRSFEDHMLAWWKKNGSGGSRQVPQRGLHPGPGSVSGAPGSRGTTPHCGLEDDPRGLAPHARAASGGGREGHGAHAPPDKFGPSEYLWQRVRMSWKRYAGERGAERGRPRERALAGAALVRAYRSPRRRARRASGRTVDDSAQATRWYNRKTGARPGSTRRSAFVGDAGGSAGRRFCSAASPMGSSAGMGRALDGP